MNILVTGGAGFVGSALCKELVKDHNVWSLDNYSTGSEANHIEGVKYINGDTRNIYLDLILGEKVKPDIVFHFGEYSRVEQSFKDINKVFQYNTQGTYRVLEYCKKHNARLIYSGSSTKFADRHQSPYAFTKSMNTDLIAAYSNWYGLDYSIAYFYNVYGPGQITEGEYATVIGIWEEQYKKGLPLTVVEPGSQTRIFTHIDDTIDALIKIAFEGKDKEYGISANEEYSVIDIAKMFDCEIEMLPERPGNRMTSDKMHTDNTEALGWKAKHKIEDYINECIRNGL